MDPIYDHNGITIYQADCRLVPPPLPAGSIDLILTDPLSETASLRKPAPVVHPLIRHSRPPSAIVLDPFVVADATLLAARQLGRSAPSATGCIATGRSSS